MKKLTVVLIATLIIMTSMCVVASATSEEAINTYNYEIDGVEYTVEFSENDFTEEKKEQIAYNLVYGDEGICTYDARCDMFGHAFETSITTVTTHKVRTYAPRCKRETYEVSVCTRCDYQTKEYIGTSYIDCCLVD